MRKILDSTTKNGKMWGAMSIMKQFEEYRLGKYVRRKMLENATWDKK